ncbi:MAG: FAD:protein FMN transferase [Flavobacteriales bacterium]|nr:FAD:protein FMN transferase [Flavobacteriales bacterium]
MKYYTFLFFVPLIICSCDNTKGEQKAIVTAEIVQGVAQGTTYSIKYNGEHKVTKLEIDSVLRGIDLSLSAWVDESTLTAFNNSDSITVKDPHFLTVFYRSEEVYDVTGGAFQPMIMPLTRAWGFGPEGGQVKNDINIDSIRTLVNFDVVALPNENSQSVTFLKKAGRQLDVNGIAQGYSVDVVAEFLERRGIVNYMVEIGGELRAKGKNEKGELWRIGVDKPSSTLNERTLEVIITLENSSLATSGSYRKFYEKNGRKFSHTIDPQTGEPVIHNLLSVTVLASNCTSADAFATAFMVQGVKGTQDFLAHHPELDLSVYMIYDENGEMKTYASEKLLALIEDV